MKRTLIYCKIGVWILKERVGGTKKCIWLSMLRTYNKNIDAEDDELKDDELKDDELKDDDTVLREMVRPGSTIVRLGEYVSNMKTNSPDIKQPAFSERQAVRRSQPICFVIKLSLHFVQLIGPFF